MGLAKGSTKVRPSTENMETSEKWVPSNFMMVARHQILLILSKPGHVYSWNPSTQEDATWGLTVQGHSYPPVNLRPAWATWGSVSKIYTPKPHSEYEDDDDGGDDNDNGDDDIMQLMLRHGLSSQYWEPASTEARSPALLGISIVRSCLWSTMAIPTPKAPSTTQNKTKQKTDHSELKIK